MSKKCVQCGAILQDDDQFCTECGAAQPVERRCPKCHAPVKEGAAFCTNCGAKLDGEGTVRETAVSARPSKNTQYMKIGAIIGACVVVLLILVGVFANMSKQDGEDSANGNNGAVISVKAADMTDDYIRDQATAETKYKGKKVNITGQLVYKRQFKNSQNYFLVIHNKKAAGKNYAILIDVAPKNVSMVNSIKPGDFVTAEGTCVGIVQQDDPTDITVEIQSDKVNQ